MRHDDACIRRWGMTGLMGLGTEARQAKAEIAAALDDTSPDVRILAAQVLCGFGETEAAVSMLVRELTHSSHFIRFDALWTLAKIGEPARPALPHLERAQRPFGRLEPRQPDDRNRSFAEPARGRPAAARPDPRLVRHGLVETKVPLGFQAQVRHGEAPIVLAHNCEHEVRFYEVFLQAAI